MRIVLVMSALMFVFSVIPAHSADVKEKYPIKESLEYKNAKDRFSGNVSFYWGNQPHPSVVTKYGNFKTSKRTNAFGKARADACAWAMASALDALQDRAIKEGGNAVINIESNIKNNPESSQTEFSCLAGTMMVNVALKGDVVKLAK